MSRAGRLCASVGAYGRDGRFVGEDVEPGGDEQRHCLERAQGDELLMLRRQRQGVENAVQLLGMVSIELRMEEELSEAIPRKARLLDQPLDRGSVGVERLQLEKPQDRDGMAMADPEVQGADQRRHLGRRRPGNESCGVDAEGLEVVESRTPRRPAVQFLRDVSLQVPHEASGDGIVRGENSRALERRLHQWDHGEGDVRAGRQKPGTQLTSAGALQQQSPRGREFGEDEVELSPQVSARRRHADG
jgi:hypothetical protein